MKIDSSLVLDLISPLGLCPSRAAPDNLVGVVNMSLGEPFCSLVNSKNKKRIRCRSQHNLFPHIDTTFYYNNKTVNTSMRTQF